MSGPTGSGKTCGAREVLHLAGYECVVELDGADAESTAQLLDWVKRNRDTQGMGGKVAVLLDDFESFTEHARRALGKLFSTKAATAVHLAPLVVTCTEFRDPAVRDLASLFHRRLFRPNEHEIYRFFRTRHTWRHVQEVSRVGYDAAPLREGHSVAAMERVKDLCVHGDLRKVEKALEWNHSTRSAATEAASGTATAAPSARFLSNFDAARRLLQKRASAAEWASQAEPRDVDLLRHHLPSHVGDDERYIHLLADGLDALADMDVMWPDRYEMRDTQMPLVLYGTGTAIRVTSRARDVGALAPPPRPTRASDPPPEIPPLHWREAPRPLREWCSRTHGAGPSRASP